jgi:hypothetical protein
MIFFYDFFTPILVQNIRVVWIYIYIYIYICAHFDHRRYVVRHEHFSAYRTLLAERKNRQKTSRITSFPPARAAAAATTMEQQGERTSWCCRASTA